ncbi:MAG: CHAP domain-containing protein [Neisseriaceae bacterium]|nr:CHAP domain-containing protein [Neisseriaceae bacterium]
MMNELMMSLLEKLFNAQISLNGNGEICVDNLHTCQTASDWLISLAAISNSNVFKCIGEYEKIKSKVSEIPFKKSDDNNCWATTILMLKRYYNQNVLSLRDAYLKQARAWLGKNEKDKSFRIIIDTYNSLPDAKNKWKARKNKTATPGKIDYADHWCSCFASAVAIACGVQDIVPIETSSHYHMRLAQDNHIWTENKKGEYVTPNVGWLILFDKEGSSSPDHTGIVEKVDNDIETIEGNKFDERENGEYLGKVSSEKYEVKHSEIRGYIKPIWDNVPYMYKNESVLLEQLTDPQKQGVDGLRDLLKKEKEKAEQEPQNKKQDQRIVRLRVLSEQIAKKQNVKEWEIQDNNIRNWFADEIELKVETVVPDSFKLKNFVGVLPAIIAMPKEVKEVNNLSVGLDELMRQNKVNSNELYSVMFYGIYLQEGEVWCSFVNATNKHGSIKWTTLKDWMKHLRDSYSNTILPVIITQK